MKALIVYFSKYGQTQKIAEGIADVLKDSHFVVEVVDVDKGQKIQSLEAFDVVILGSPIYVSKHSKQIGQFIGRHRDALNEKTTAFYSVSLSAAGEEDQRQDARVCLEKFLAKCNWNPDRTEVFAGGLPYRQYGWFTRFLMKRMINSAGGDTDTSRDYEYTDWKSVDDFASSFSNPDQDSVRVADSILQPTA